MEVNLYNQKAENIGKVELPDSVFGIESNNDLLHQVVSSQIANQRQILAHAKTRAEVRGGGKKPWRQKGTGQARHGSIRSPLWKGGGATFGPTKERNFKKKVNRKMAKRALFAALSSKAKDKQIFIVDDIRLENLKTKEMAAVFKNFSFLLGKNPNSLLVLPAADKKVKRVADNLTQLSVVEARNLNPLEVLSHKNLMILKDAIEVIYELRM